jgi:thiamine-phosphate pyrophosphorylase
MFSLVTKVYPITDKQVSGLSHAKQVARLCEGGATLIQLREKNLSPSEFFREAGEAMHIARSYGARVIINDRVDMVLALQADGVHLGQDDLPPEAARRLLGDHRVLGLSTHNVWQAREATRMPIDYIGIGPIFTTSSKANPDPVVGIEGLRQVRNAVGHIPLVAIGGITEVNASEVIAAGADAVAMISAIFSGPTDVPSRLRNLILSL